MYKYDMGDKKMLKSNEETRQQVKSDVLDAHQNTDWYSSFEKLLPKITYADVQYPNIQSVALQIVKGPVSSSTTDGNNQSHFRSDLKLVLTYVTDSNQPEQVSFVENMPDTNTDMTDEIITSQFVRQLLGEYIFGGRVGFARLTKDTITLRGIKLVKK